MFHFNRSTFIVVVFGSILLITLFLIGGVAGFVPTVVRAKEGNLVVNPGFEDDGVGTGDPVGWISIGDDYADYTESGGHTGDFRLAHWNAYSYAVATTQTNQRSEQRTVYHASLVQIRGRAERGLCRSERLRQS